MIKTERTKRQNRHSINKLYRFRQAFVRLRPLCRQVFVRIHLDLIPLLLNLYTPRTFSALFNKASLKLLLSFQVPSTLPVYAPTIFLCNLFLNSSLIFTLQSHKTHKCHHLLLLWSRSPKFNLHFPNCQVLIRLNILG